MKWIRWRSAVVGDLEADGTASFNVELYSSSYERSEESGGGSFETSAHGGPGPLTMPSDLENVTAILRGLLAEAGAPSVLSDTATVTCPMEYRDRYGWSPLVPAYTPAVARPWLYRDRYGWSTIVFANFPPTQGIRGSSTGCADNCRATAASIGRRSGRPSSDA